MTYKLTIKQGSTFRLRFVYKAGSDAATATPVNLTNCTARAQMRPDYPSTTIWGDWSTSNGGIVLGGVNGTIEMYSSASDTANMPAENGVWDLEIAGFGAVVARILGGQSEVTPEVTR